ncbi:MAG: DUF2975 domain-containing protein [Ruminococcus sp.]|nr:DUF2975 domain-containing protein [Ruminococcus sp.]
MKNKEKIDKALPLIWIAGFAVSALMIVVSLILSIRLGMIRLIDGAFFGLINVAFFALLAGFFSKMRKVFADMKNGKTLIESIFPHLTLILTAFIGGVELRILSQGLLNTYQLYFNFVQDSSLSIWKCTEFSDNVVTVLYTFGVILSAFELFRIFRGRDRDEVLGISSLEMRAKVAGRICAFLNILLGFSIIICLTYLVFFIISISKDLSYLSTYFIVNIAADLFRYILVFSAIFLIMGIMRHVKKDTPFALECAPKLRFLGILYGVYFVFDPAASLIGQIIRNNQLAQGEPTSILSSIGNNISLSISPVNLIICIILLVLANIFSHASELQKQSDETL